MLVLFFYYLIGVLLLLLLPPRKVVPSNRRECSILFSLSLIACSFLLTGVKFEDFTNLSVLFCGVGDPFWTFEWLKYETLLPPEVLFVRLVLFTKPAFLKVLPPLVCCNFSLSLTNGLMFSLLASSTMSWDYFLGWLMAKSGGSWFYWIYLWGVFCSTCWLWLFFIWFTFYWKESPSLSVSLYACFLPVFGNCINSGVLETEVNPTPACKLVW